MKCGCENCKYCKVYRGDYWTPDDYECVSTVWDRVDADEEGVRRAWENGETWEHTEEPLCIGYEEVPTEEDMYWEKYAYDERFTERR